MNSSKIFGSTTLYKAKPNKSNTIKITHHTFDSCSILQQFESIDKVLNHLKVTNQKLYFRRT